MWKFIYVSDGKAVKFETIGKFRLLLKTIFYLDLDKTFIVLSFTQNLISISALDNFFLVGNKKFSLFHDLKWVGSDSLTGYDNPYLLI